MNYKDINTVWTVHYVSHKAFLAALQGFTRVEAIQETNNTTRITFSRSEYDENGYHEGYCYWTIHIEKKKRSSNFCWGNIPLRPEVEEFVLDVSNFKIGKVSAPRKSRTYYPPDKEILYQESSYFLQGALEKMEEATFRAEDRTWYLADEEYPLEKKGE